MDNRRIGIAGIMAAGLAAGLMASSGAAEVLPRVYSDHGRTKRSRPRYQGIGGYPGAKLAKKARKGMLTHNGIR